MVPVSTHPLTKAGQLRSLGDEVLCLYFCGFAVTLLPSTRVDLLFFLFLPVSVSAPSFDIFVLTKEPSRKGHLSFMTRLFTRVMEAFGPEHTVVMHKPSRIPYHLF